MNGYFQYTGNYIFLINKNILLKTTEGVGGGGGGAVNFSRHFPGIEES